MELNVVCERYCKDPPLTDNDEDAKLKYDPPDTIQFPFVTANAEFVVVTTELSEMRSEPASTCAREFDSKFQLLAPDISKFPVELVLSVTRTTL